jgi:hypothetical protein
MTIPPYAERVYEVTAMLVDDDEPYIVRWLNEPRGPDGVRLAGPFPSPTGDRFATGFPRDAPPPILEFDRPLPKRKALYEAYSFISYWCVSDALKQTLYTIDPNAFDSVLAQTRFPDGSSGPDYWLLDVVCFRDCYDQSRSTAAGARVSGRGLVDFAIGAPDGNFFHARTLNSALFFHLPRHADSILCVERAKTAIEAAGHTRLHFFPVGWSV